MDKREKALYQAILALSTPDLRNELERDKNYVYSKAFQVQTTATG